MFGSSDVVHDGSRGLGDSKFGPIWRRDFSVLVSGLSGKAVDPIFPSGCLGQIPQWLMFLQQ